MICKVYIDIDNPARSISARQARVIVRKLTAGFRKMGVRAGHSHVVCVHAFNDIMYSMLFLGIVAAGGIFAGTNPSYTPYELAHHMRSSQTRYVITEPEMLNSIVKAANECSIPNSNILIFNVLGQAIPDGFTSWETLLNQGEEDWVRFQNLQAARTTESARLFSSGTTGLPKAAMISHYNLVAEHTLTWGNDLRDYQVRKLLCLPQFHVAAVPMAHTTTLKIGEVAYVMRRFDLIKFLSAIERFQITDLLIVPPIVIATIMSPHTKKHDLSSLKAAYCGAAPLGKNSQKTFEALMGRDAAFTQVFGK